MAVYMNCGAGFSMRDTILMPEPVTLLSSVAYTIFMINVVL